MTEVMLRKVPPHWRVEPIGRLFRERNEKVSDTDFPPLSVTKNGIVPQLESAAKSDDGDNRKLVRKGDFVINSRSDRKGSSGLSNLDGSVSLISIILEPVSIEPPFAHYLLRCEAFQEEFYRWGHGIVADLWTTRFKDMKSIRIAVPDRPTQRAVAAFLDRETAKIDTLIAKQEALIERIAEKRAASITELVLRGTNPEALLRPSGVDWIGDIPLHWTVRSLTSASTKITNGYVGPTRDIFVDKGVNYLQSLHIKNNRILFNQPYYVTEQWSRAHSKSILSTGDVLIVQTGDIGQVAVVPQEFSGANCHALIVVSTIKSVISGDYLAWVLNSDYGFNSLKSMQTGALHPHLNCGTVKFIQVPVPPLGEQEQIVSKLTSELSKFDELTRALEQQIELSVEHRAALITAAVTGQIEVAANLAVEAAA